MDLNMSATRVSHYNVYILLVRPKQVLIAIFSENYKGSFSNDLSIRPYDNGYYTTRLLTVMGGFF